jgi:hypothetical protein
LVVVVVLYFCLTYASTHGKSFAEFVKLYMTDDVGYLLYNCIGHIRCMVMYRTYDSTMIHPIILFD